MFVLDGAGWTTLHCGGGPESPKSCNSPSGFLLSHLARIFANLQSGFVTNCLVPPITKSQ